VADLRTDFEHLRESHRSLVAKLGESDD